MSKYYFVSQPILFSGSPTSGEYSASDVMIHVPAGTIDRVSVSLQGFRMGFTDDYNNSSRSVRDIGATVAVNTQTSNSLSIDLSSLLYDGVNAPKVEACGCTASIMVVYH